MGEEIDQTYLVFAGSGASKAVGMDQYPTTVEFFERLPKEVTQDRLFREIVSFLTHHSPSSTIFDIELVLWRLEELAEFCGQACDTKQLAGWFLDGGRLPSALGRPTENVGSLPNMASAGTRAIKKLRDDINAQVYKFYGQLPKPDRLEETWIPLLRPLLKTGARVEIVTTNYDVVLEAALDQLTGKVSGQVDTGWRGTVQRILDSRLWTGTTETGLLTKLHGSVNWTRDDNQIYISDPTFKGSHDKHVIIYPGFKGKASDPIFQGFHSHFRNALAKSTAIAFVGFAFRDGYINELCERYIREKARVVVIDPNPSIKLPFSQASLEHIPNGFDRASATRAASVMLNEWTVTTREPALAAK